MKIVQSHWSKPALARKNQFGIPAGSKSGWTDKKYYYLSWVLSVHQFRKYYDKAELVTDEVGYELLIKKLELPYTSVKVVLDELNSYHEDMWALGKIFAYKIQDEPFIHADYDVFIWDRFESRLEEADLVCQSKEEGMIYNRTYFDRLFPIARHFEYYPAWLNRAMDRKLGIKCLNAGILGGNNIDFFNEFCEQVFLFLDHNTGCFEKIKVETLNVIFEQVLFRCLADEKNLPITYLFQDESLFPTLLVQFMRVPARVKYIHPFGAFKEDFCIANWLERFVQSEYPAQYHKVMNLIRMHEI